MTRRRLAILVAALGIACGLAFGARAQGVAREARMETTPATVDAGWAPLAVGDLPQEVLPWAELVQIPGVEADIRGRLLLGEACESARVACREHVDDLRLAALAADDVIAGLKARIAEQDAEIARLRTDLARAEKAALKRPKAWPRVLLGAVAGAGVAVAVCEVNP